MREYVTQISFVIAARSHNPTIINKDWLERNNVIDPDVIGGFAAPPIITPPFAQLVYDSGITINLQEQTLICMYQINNGVDEDLLKEIKNIVTRYSSLLPHIPYTAVGTNINFTIPLPDPDRYIVDLFLQETNLSRTRAITKAGLQIFYEVAGGRLTLQTDGQLVTTADEDGNPVTTSNLVIQGNLHRDLEAGASQIGEIVKGFPEDERNYLEVVESLIQQSH